VAVITDEVLELAEGGTIYLPASADLETWLSSFNRPSKYRCDGDGQVVIWMPPAFPPRSQLALMLMSRLVAVVEAERLPIRCFGADARFLLDAPRARWVTPDGALVRRDRIPPAVRQQASGAWPVLPDLAIEVLSPSDPPQLSSDKIGLYRAARAPRLWVLDPRSRTVAVWLGGELVATLTEPTDALELLDLVRDWRLALHELWKVGE
jgi:Uma2 family endonuclease